MKVGDSVDTVLALDFGTQGVKGFVVSQDGGVLSSAFRHYGFSKNEDGCMEENPQEWIDAAASAIAELNQNAQDAMNRIACVGLSGHMHGIVPLAADGTALHPCILWCDTRCAPQAERLRELLPDDVRRRLKNPFVTAYSMGKLAWLKEKRPQVWKDMSVFLYCKDYIRYLMTGNVMTDYSDASGSLLYDFESDAWCPQACEAVGLSGAKLPSVRPSAALAGRVTAEGARRFHLREGVPVAVGAGDLAASLLGSGACSEHDVLINLGTAGQILALKARGESQRAGGHTFKFLDARKDMRLFSIPSAAYCARWYVEQVCPSFADAAKASGQSVFDLMHASASASPPGARGLLFAPYLSGTGSPYFDDQIRGAWIGLDSAHGCADMARSILEGVAFGIKQCVEMDDGPAAARRIRLTGGGARSRVWRQIFADVLESEIVCPDVPEAAGLGAAKLAMMACGMDANRVQVGEERVRPNMEHRQVYARAYQRYLRIYAALKAMA